MSFREIRELREAEKLDEALEMVKKELESEPENIWNKRAAAWVYYDYLKKYSQPESFDAFKENLIKIKDLQFPEDEKMVFDTSAWQIGSMIFGLQKQENVDYRKINELFDIIKEFHFTKPSEAYSFIYKAFHKGYQNWSKYLEFADWWNFKNFRPEDYLKEKYKDKKIMAIAEQAYIAYSKKLLEGKPVDPFGQQRAVDKNKIREFLPQLDRVIDDHPEHQYPPYFKAKLLLALGDENNILSSFLPFAKQKRNDFWVWDLMAQIYNDNNDLALACYCKALSLNSPSKFLIKIRKKLVKLLLKKQQFDEAKTEIVQVDTVIKEEGWNKSNEVEKWKAKDWFNNAKNLKSNNDLYKKHKKDAEELLFQNIKEETVVVEFVNSNKNVVNFIKDKTKYGFFKYEQSLETPAIGDVLKVRFNGKGTNEGYYKVLTVKHSDQQAPSDIVRNISGPLKVVSPANFGFVKDVYVHPSMITKNNLEKKDGFHVKGKAILSFNRKKNEWGWKAIQITLTD